MKFKHTSDKEMKAEVIQTPHQIMNKKKSLLKVPHKDLDLHHFLGVGGSGTVFLGTWEGRKIAYKSFVRSSTGLANYNPTTAVSESVTQEFERELEILYQFKHPYICEFFGIVLEEYHCGYIMEFYENGDLGNFLKAYKKKYKTSYSIRGKILILQQIASALKFLHSKSILHRDIKCGNVLIDHRYNVRLVDFGLSRLFRDSVDDESKTKQVGTVDYMAPEMINEFEYNETVDVYSYSILCYVVMTECYKPYLSISSNNNRASNSKGLSGIQLLIKVSSDPKFRPDINAVLPGKKKEYKWLRDIITSGWSHKPSRRKSFNEIFEIFAEHVKTDNIVVYLKYSDEPDDESDDYELKDLSLKGLEDVIMQKTKGKRPKSICLNDSPIENDHQVSLIDNASVISIIM